MNEGEKEPNEIPVDLLEKAEPETPNPLDEPIASGEILAERGHDTGKEYHEKWRADYRDWREGTEGVLRRISTEEDVEDFNKDKFSAKMGFEERREVLLSNLVVLRKIQKSLPPPPRKEPFHK